MKLIDQIKPDYTTIARKLREGEITRHDGAEVIAKMRDYINELEDEYRVAIRILKSYREGKYPYVALAEFLEKNGVK